MNLRRILSALSAVSVLSASLFGQTLPIFNSRITGTAEVKSGGEIEIESGATLDVQSGATVSFGDALSLANGGTGASLTAPGADRLLFWDDSGSAVAWLTVGTGLSLSGTTLTATAEGGFENPMTTAGDVIIGGTDGAAERLAIGTTGQVLTVVDGAPAWDDAAAGAALPAEPTEGDLAYYDGEAWVSLAIGTNGQVLVVDTGAPAWDDAPTSGFSNPMTTAEDLIVGGTDGAAERLGVGSEGQVLKVVSGAVAWGTDSTGSGSLPGEPSAGDLAYYDGEDWLSLAIGTAGQVLVVNSGATAPEWDDAPSGGSGGTATLARWTALGNQPPASAFATLDTRNAIAVLDFDDSTDEAAVFVGIIPEGADLSSGIEVRIHWMATSATTGDVIWTSAIERSNTDLDSDSFATAVSGSAATTNATSGIVTVTTIAHSDSEIDGVTAGDLFRVKITRDADNGSDTMSGDAELIAVEIRRGSS